MSAMAKSKRSSFVQTKKTDPPSSSSSSSSSTTTSSGSKKRRSIVTERKTHSAPSFLCPICHEAVGLKNPEGITEEYSALRCGHVFGSHCIKEYLRIVADDKPLCPVCRASSFHSTCGHPVVPVRLKSSSGRPSGEQTLAMTSANCGYCETRLPAPGFAARRKQQTGGGFKAAIIWIIDHAFRSTSGRQRVNATREFAAAISRPEPGMAGRRPGTASEWTGPWVDLPKKRDPAWERWYNSQI